jgi:acyl carrier protein
MRPSAEEIERWLAARLAEGLEVSLEEIDPEGDLNGFGLDSAVGVEITGELERWLGLTLPETLFWDYPTLRSIAQHLGG